MIAMKSYLLFFVFFLSTLSLPLSTFAQEDHPSSSSHSNQAAPSLSDESFPYDQQKDELRSYPEGETPGIGIDHTPRESDTFQTKFFNMIFLLGLLIGFMILASWALKRMMKSKMTQLNTASHIKVIETRYLSPRATLYLVEVYNQSFLIAESPTTISHLATLPIEEEDVATTSPLPPPFPKT